MDRQKFNSYIVLAGLMLLIASTLVFVGWKAYVYGGRKACHESGGYLGIDFACEIDEQRATSFYSPISQNNQSALG